MIQNFKINKKSLELFETPSWQRVIRQGNVDKFKKSIKNQAFHGTLLTINKTDKYRIINGNHRFEAIKQLIQNNPGMEVEVILDITNGLNEEDEKKLFSDISIETPQNINDFLHIHKDNIKFFNDLQKMPVRISIYPNKTSIRLKTILDGILSAKNKSINFDLRSFDKEDSLETAKNLTQLDIKILREFLECLKSAVGLKDQDAYVYKPMILIPLINVFFRHRLNSMLNKLSQWTKEDWIQLFNKVRIDNIIISYSDIYSSRSKMQDVRERILYLSRSGRINKTGWKALI